MHMKYEKFYWDSRGIIIAMPVLRPIQLDEHMDRLIKFL